MVYTQEGVIKDSRPWAKIFVTGAAAVTLAGAMLMNAFAASPVIVTSTNTQGWNTADTRATGTVEIVPNADPVHGNGALKLATGANTVIGTQMQDKAQYMHAANVKLSDITTLGYDTKQISSAFSEAAPSFQLVIDTDGTVDGVNWATLVYEPYNNALDVQPNVWQSWDVDAGTMWSTKTIAGINVNGGLVNGAGGPPFYTLSDVIAKYPDAVVYGFGVNVGSNNPNWDTRVDLINFNGTVYNFETSLPTAETKEDCKNNGFASLYNKDGQLFKNQGQCVSSVQANANASFKRGEQ